MNEQSIERLVEIFRQTLKVKATQGCLPICWLWIDDQNNSGYCEMIPNFSEETKIVIFSIAESMATEDPISSEKIDVKLKPISPLN